MAKTTYKLTAKQIVSLPPGKHSDGGNLYVRVRKGGSRQFVVFYRAGGKQREMGLGGAGAGGMSLADARANAEEIRAKIRNGHDPLAAKADIPTRTSVPTFGEYADAYVASHEAGWKNKKHRDQWKMTLKVYAVAIRNRPVDKITTADLQQLLTPIWLSKNETAARLRGRIAMILDAARVEGHIAIDAPNPARFQGHLQLLLPKYSAANKGHYAAMEISAIPSFIAELRRNVSVAALALEFLILTAARTGEALGAMWPQIDFAERLWTIPAGKMKSERVHQVPLCARAIEILKIVGKLSDTSDQYAFQGRRKNRPLSNMALEMVLRRMNLTSVTVHGFRSTFRDWAGDYTTFPREVAEAALAHAVGDKSERAYRRRSALAKRRKLMNAWAKYCGSGLRTA
jgi:integrase